jgi:hypothetical protein
MPFKQADDFLLGPITNSVGANAARNKAMDVALVQNLLNISAKVPEVKRKTFYDPKPEISVGSRITAPTTVTKKHVLPLVVNGKCDATTIARIKSFQTEFLSFKPDGSIGARGDTWKKLIAVTQVKIRTSSKIQLIFGAPLVSIELKNIDKARFKSLIQSHLQLNKANEECAAFITNLVNDSTLTNFRWAAYYLATAYHETGFCFNHVSEYGKGSIHDYGKSISVIDTEGYRGAKGKTYSNAFYGRGLIQLTHGGAYKYVSTKIGLRKDELYVNPDKALEPKVSYDIMTYWMQNNIPNVKGAGRTIQEYTSSVGLVDYQGARRIVNRKDEDLRIARYAMIFEILLILCAR